MKFSIAVPAYKAKFLKECIESILAQTYKNFELIIVNDASPEDLTSIVKSFNDPRIRYFVNEKNCGSVNVVDNWNKCLEYANGDYTICMGDDDKLLPHCLEEYARLINKYSGLGVYHGWTEIIDEHSKVIRMQEPRPLTESVYSMIWHRWHGRLQYIGDFLFDTKLLRLNGGFYKIPMAWGADDITAYIAAQDKGIANTQVPVFQYRINSQTISSTGSAVVKLEATIQEEKWYKSFLKKEPDANRIIEHIYWTMARSYLPSFIMKKRIYIIVEDIQRNGVQCLLKYSRLRRRYSLSLKMIAYAVIEILKRENIKKRNKTVISDLK